MNKLGLPSIEIRLDPVIIVWFFLSLLPVVNFIFLYSKPVSLHDYVVLHLKMLAGAGFIMTFIVSLTAFLYSFRVDKEKGFFETTRKIMASYLPFIAIGASILAALLIISTLLDFDIDKTISYTRTILTILISICVGLLWTAALITLGIIIVLSRIVIND